MKDSTSIPYGGESSEAPLAFTGERFVPGTRGDIEVEHVHRYLFARQFATDRDVLDIACGEGYGAALLAGPAQRVIGVDVDEHVVRRATAVHAADGLEFLRGSCTAIPVADHSVDLVVSFETIEHIEAHEAFLAEIRRVLRPSGLLIMSTPDTGTYLKDAVEENPFHVKELDRQEFIDTLAGHFASVRFGIQRCVTGSVMVPLDGESTMSTPGLYRLDGSASRVHDDGRLADHGLFLIGLASDDPLPAIDWSLLDDPSFALADQVGMQHRVATLEGSVAEYEAAMRTTVDELHAIRRSWPVRVASRLGLIPRRPDVDP